MEQKIQVNEKKPAGLVFFEGQEKPQQYVIFQKVLVQGQCDTQVFTTSDLVLAYPFLDAQQCEIYREDDKWYYRNLSEDTFTFVGGKSLGSGAVTQLKDGDVIRISNDRMLTAIFLEEFVSGVDWQILNMDDGRHMVRLADTESAKNMAAITLQYEDGHWTVQELHAKQVIHNGSQAFGPVQIRIDDCIQIGESRFFFEGSGLVYGYPIQRSGLSIQIDERSVHKAMKKIPLLKDINLSIEPGNLVLILGGSGAGKSTFVNAVTGYEKAKATIKEGDIDYYRDYGQIKHRIGFVPQENLLREEDTVISTVRNAAQLRLPSSMDAQEKERAVQAVLTTFGLADLQKELVSKLSGGQKKRLSICTEFIASPYLFILDEPDSGLDGIMAMELMENLRLIACQGRIVMVITHAPDRVAHLFDKVIVLAKGTESRVGQLAFYGGIQEARDFFGTDTMEGIVKCINAKSEGGAGRADEFIDKYKAYAAERDQSASGWYRDADPDHATAAEETPEHFADSKKTKQTNEDATSVQYTGRAGQIPVYFGKQMRLFINERNWKVIPMAAIVAFLIVYVLGSRMFQNMEYTKYGSLAIVCVCIWNGMFNSIQSICKERDILKREHRAGLHMSSYLIAHLLYQAIICLIQVLISLLIFKVFGMHFPDTGLITGSFGVDLFITMFLVTYSADMLAIMISCIVKNPTTAMTVLPFVLIVQLVFTGTIFPLNRQSAQVISDFTISNWGINAVNIAADYNAQPSIVLYSAINKMSGSENEIMEGIRDILQTDEIKDYLQNWTASKMQEAAYDYTVSNMWKCWGILIIFSVVYAGIGLLFLEFIDRDKR